MIKKNIYAGLFMVTLATLMLEILLTRIFSVIMWYHFAFVAISVSMFGMTVGAIIVYLLPGYFTEDRAGKQLALSSLLFSFSIVFSFLTQLSIPFVHEWRSIVGLYSIAFTYAVISIPFVFSGICVCLALTKFPKHVSKLYAADLAGAAFGCILLIWVLKISDGPTAVVITASLASLGALLFAVDRNSKKLFGIAIATLSLFLSFSAVNTFLAHNQSSLLRVKWVKGYVESTPLYEKWNPFSRIAVFGSEDAPPEKPSGWGISKVYGFEKKIRQLGMNIDASASTVLTKFNGDLNSLEYLKYDITNLVHYLRPDSKVLIIGTGGGRDILSALIFHQGPIVGVEINEDIIKTVNQKFGNFTGHLDKQPGVYFVNDEARSYIARIKDKFDIIQASLIDTAAATAAGAYVLSENSLYTVEAWKIFLDHLTPAGILTFSRFYGEGNPIEVYRLTSLAAASLIKAGIKNPRDHILIAKQGPGGKKTFSVGTMLISKKPFSEEDVNIFKKIANDMKFDTVLTPQFSIDTTFAAIASGKDSSKFISKFPINIAAPTDNSPFFFNMLRMKDILNIQLLSQVMPLINMQAIFILGILFIIVVEMTLLCIIVPLMLTTKAAMLKGSLPFFIFFMAIGFGFMFIEISQMQRMIIFLGHPTYGLSVVLFALLLSSGLGSFSTQRMGNMVNGKAAIICLSFLLCILSIFGMFTPRILSAFQEAPTMLRILVAVGVLFPPGFFMGMPFPLGLKSASTRLISATPWFWGINGATSVCASVIAVIIALSYGISATFWTGVACYFVAFLMFRPMGLRTI